MEIPSWSRNLVDVFTLASLSFSCVSHPVCSHLISGFVTLGPHFVLICHTWGAIVFSLVTLGGPFCSRLSHLGPILFSFCHTWGPFCSHFDTLGSHLDLV